MDVLKNSRTGPSRGKVTLEQTPDRTLTLVPRSEQPWTRHKVVTVTRIQRAVKAGWGQGRDESYHPWIRIRRNISSPVSNLYVLCNPLYRHRAFHLLSGIEFAAANFALWVGATEIREQMPIWANSHLHPNSGRPGEGTSTTLVPGIVEIAKGAGIKPGFYPGTDIFFIHTVDLLVEVKSKLGNQLICVACKPTSKLTGAGSKRVAERLRLESLYANAIGAGAKIFTECSIPKNLVAALDWLTPLASEWARFRDSDQLQDFAGEFMAHADNVPLRECRLRAAKKTVLPHDDLDHALFRMAAWRGLIDIDLCKPIIFDQMLNRDRSKARLADEVLGVQL